MPFPLYYTDGKVGIGVTNPDAELDVNGDVDISGTLTVAGSAVGGAILPQAVGAVPNAAGASASGMALTLQPADGTHPGVVTSGAQTIGGAKTFSGAISASNLSGTNTGDVTLGTFGSSPDAKGATISAQVVTLQPADDTHPGLVTIAAQTLAGQKTFSASPRSAFGYGSGSQDGGNQGLSFTGGDAIIRGTNIIYLQATGVSGNVQVNSVGLDLSPATTQTTRFAYTDATGSPGDAVINKPSGRVRISSTGTSLVVTNSVCTAGSMVIATLLTDDAAAKSVSVQPTPGSFTLTLNAACTGAVDIDFLVVKRA